MINGILAPSSGGPVQITEACGVISIPLIILFYVNTGIGFSVDVQDDFGHVEMFEVKRVLLITVVNSHPTCTKDARKSKRPHWEVTLTSFVK